MQFLWLIMTLIYRPKKHIFDSLLSQNHEAMMQISLWFRTVFKTNRNSWTAATTITRKCKSLCIQSDALQSNNLDNEPEAATEEMKGAQGRAESCYCCHDSVDRSRSSTMDTDQTQDTISQEKQQLTPVLSHWKQGASQRRSLITGRWALHVALRYKSSESLRDE